MSKRISHSPIDPWLSPMIRSLYRSLPIPEKFPPEGIIAVGHVFAIVGAIGFANAASVWWGGVLVAIGVAGNHTADVMDGTHARATNQCRNGGELLDHFADPLSFSYWLCGMAFCVNRLDWGLIAVICLYATAVLTNIKAKMIGEFTLATFGPTEFKALLILYGLTLSLLTAGIIGGVDPQKIATWFFAILIAVGVAQLIRNLIRAVYEVNRHGGEPDTTEWETKE